MRYLKLWTHAIIQNLIKGSVGYVKHEQYSKTTHEEDVRQY